ncbi:hypothetical protein NBRGN_046_00210 [Nocardia brasiliensis NBRC 14402]|uniref:hypothetical protein n=1 Tax=Nocardia brasiliensis TaxID=37326 RepID=UPI00045CFF46|nr:hypothetical protein [Nocardia brasiliensis]ASF12370.1 hypothetical protein CEQ30_39120 [Nocardia brasiliensis]GAJ82056.1 hypothetical protein NBRGN_046_00210 [Nocardia brasiliensis NBRC 14402]
MPSLRHEAPLELLRHNPLLAAALLAGTGIPLAADTRATITDSNLSTCEPPEYLADAVTLLEGAHGKLAVITESQSAPPKRRKRRAWPAYVAVAQAQHKCDAVLVVITDSPATARACRRTVRTGHPGFDLTPIVIGPHNTPAPNSSAFRTATPELTVLASLTHALDLDDDATRRMVLDNLADLDRETRNTYTRFVRHAASDAATKALEELMASSIYRDEFMDGLLDQGRAEGEAKGEAKSLLRILAVRRFTVPDDLHTRIMACTDTEQLESWIERAVVAESLAAVFDL